MISAARLVSFLVSVAPVRPVGPGCRGTVAGSFRGLPEEPADKIGDAGENLGRNVLVPGGHAGLRPAHHVHDGPSRHLQDEKHGGCGVPGVVKPRRPHLGFVEKIPPFLVVGPRVDRPAVRLSEDPPLLAPQVGGGSAFLVLGVPVELQPGQQGRGNSESPPPGFF